MQQLDLSGLAVVPADAGRLARLQRLAAQLSSTSTPGAINGTPSADGTATTSAAPGSASRQAAAGGGGERGVKTAIVAVSGWDSCWHAESAALLRWLCGGAAPPPDAFAVITADSAAVLAPAIRKPSSGGGGGGDKQQKQQMQQCSAQLAAAAAAAAAAAPAAAEKAAAAASDNPGSQPADFDPKLLTFHKLLLRSGAQRVAVPLGWEVAGGALRRVGGEGALGRWPLVQALPSLGAEGQLLHARFEVRSCCGVEWSRG